MEKTYKVKLYHINDHSRNLNDKLYTKKELIQYVNTITPVISYTIDEAVSNLKQYEKWDIIETYINIDNDDIAGNVKPDNTFTKTLEFGEFDNIVNKDENIIANFSTLNDEQKLTICTFIDKNIKLLADTHSQNKPNIVTNRCIDIINDLVYELFLAASEDDIKCVIKQMNIFNKINNQKLLALLNETIENLTVKELFSKEDEYINPISNNYWNKIITESNQ